MKITLKDGSVKEYESATTAAEITKDISMGLYRNACCCRINGAVKDLRTVVDSDCEFEVLTFDEEDGKKAFNHTASHVMAQAVKRLYPDTKLTIGPAIENGFYYDFDVETPFGPEDLEKIEKEMKKIIKENYPIEKFELPVDEAIKLMQDKDEPYKIELINEHAGKGEAISFYKQGEFTELCAGPHIPEMKVIKAFKLTKNATTEKSARSLNSLQLWRRVPDFRSSFRKEWILKMLLLIIGERFIKRQATLKSKLL